MCFSFASCADKEGSLADTASSIPQTESASVKAETELKKETSTEKVNISKEKTTLNKAKKAQESSSAAATTAKPQPSKQPVQATSAERPTTEKQTQAEEKKITVSLVVSCKNALKYDEALPKSGCFLNECIEAEEGENAFSVLEAACKRQGLDIEARGNYIVAIGGLHEKQYTSASGWMYSVNGSLPNKPAKKYILKNGDKVEFYYITSPSDRA